MAKRYSPKLKFQIAMEVLRDNKTPSQVAKAYGVHPNSVNKWTKTVLEEGPELFAEDGAVAEYERRIAELERLLGQKEVQIALLKNFLGRTP
jgi:transposase-like protein